MTKKHNNVTLREMRDEYQEQLIALDKEIARNPTLTPTEVYHQRNLVARRLNALSAAYNVFELVGEGREKGFY